MFTSGVSCFTTASMETSVAEMAGGELVGVTCELTGVFPRAFFVPLDFLGERAGDFDDLAAFADC